MDSGSGCISPGSCSMWHKPSWRKLPLDPSQRHWADNPWTAEQLYQRNSHTVNKVLGPTTDFSTWGSGKGTENLQGIRHWRPVGFDYKTSTGLGEQALGGHKQNHVCTRSQEKGAVSPQVTELEFPVRVRESLVEAWVNTLASGQTIGREHSLPHQQKIGLNITEYGPRPSEQDPVSPTVIVSHQEASITLLSLFIRGQTEWKPQSQKNNQTDHMDYSLV